MKIVLAIDSFKGSLTSAEAEQAVKEGILARFPDCEVVCIPIADGGEGTLSVMMEATQGTYRTTMAHNPCMEKIETQYGISSDGQTAFIEMANISGLPLIDESRKNPMKTTTFGTGELIKDALEQGCTQFIVGIGGSATNDAGTGMLQALGFRFLDKEGKELGQGGEILPLIEAIDSTQSHPLLERAHFIVACDVRNPFYGPEGAAYVFAGQKGADDHMIEELDKGMQHFAQAIQRLTGKDIASIPGSGAAGGLGGGMLAFLNAKLKSGADLLLDISRLEEHLSGADLLITGEGKIDRQSLMGKIPGKVLQRGIQKRIPVIAITGCAADTELLYEAGFRGVHTTRPDNQPLTEAMKPAVAIRNIRETTAGLLNKYFQS